tara:strand:- start:195 stop:482 length:288 start_codon:yes stop_codon:yes gene_type:complete
MPIAYPYKFSDWYGYDRDCMTGFTSAAAESAIGCNETLNQTYYHDGSGARPVANDTVYTNSGGTTVLANGIYRLDNSTKFEITGGSGVVATVSSC